MLEINILLEAYNSQLREGHLAAIIEEEPRFSLKDLIGEKIIGVREVKRNKGNPVYLEVLDFESGKALVSGVESRHDKITYRMLLIEKNGNFRYSSSLFENYERVIKDIRV